MKVEEVTTMNELLMLLKYYSSTVDPIIPNNLINRFNDYIVIKETPTKFIIRPKCSTSTASLDFDIKYVLIRCDDYLVRLTRNDSFRRYQTVLMKVDEILGGKRVFQKKSKLTKVNDNLNKYKLKYDELKLKYTELEKSYKQTLKELKQLKSKIK